MAASSILLALVLLATFLNAALMSVFGLYFIEECQGSPYVPASTLILGLMTYTVFITLPYMFDDHTKLIMTKSFRIILTVALLIQAVIQMSNWAVVFNDTGTYTSNKTCSGVLDAFAVTSTSIQGVLYITLPLCLLYHAKEEIPIFKTTMQWISYLSKMTFGLIISGIVVLPVSYIVIGGISLDKCPALAPKLPVYMMGSGISLFLVLTTVAMTFVCRQTGDDDDIPGVSKCCAVFLLVCQFIFQCVGYASVFPYKLGIDVSGDPAAKDNYCDKAVYMISFANLTFTTFLDFYMPPFLFVANEHYDLKDKIWKRARFSSC